VSSQKGSVGNFYTLACNLASKAAKDTLRTCFIRGFLFGMVSASTPLKQQNSTLRQDGGYGSKVVTKRVNPLRQVIKKMRHYGVTTMNTKKVLAGLILASSGFFTAGASAALITAWDWTSDGGFVQGSSTCSNCAEAACNLQYNNAGVTPSEIPGTSSVMSWGTPSTATGSNGNQSALQGVFGNSSLGALNAQLLGSDPIPIPAFAQIITNGGWTNTGAAIHYNNIITTAGGHMDTSTLTTTFQLLTPAAGPVNQTDINIGFLESVNTAPCPAPNPHGTVCDDVFSVTALPPPIAFTFDGINYTLEFRFANGPGAMVVGNTIYTAEEAPGTAVMFVQAQILAEAVPVPVPGVLALMGMGLMLLGWRVRGRKAD